MRVPLPVLMNFPPVTLRLAVPTPPLAALLAAPDPELVMVSTPPVPMTRLPLVEVAKVVALVEAERTSVEPVASFTVPLPAVPR